MISGLIDHLALDKGSRQNEAIFNVIDVHTDFIVAVAFSEDYMKSTWLPARTAALNLLQRILCKDTDAIANTILQLTIIPKSVEDVPTAVPIKKQLWKKVYASIRSNDKEGISLIISLLARGSKLDSLSMRAFQDRLGKFMRTKSSGDVEEFVDAVESAI